MQMIKHKMIRFINVVLFLSIAACSNTQINENKQTKRNLANWSTVAASGSPTARHEASLVTYKNKLYLIGGRRINPTDVYDPKNNTWTKAAKTPIELHHFQAVVYGDAIYLMGAMTGGWPNETPVERVIIYYPERDEYVFGDEIPEQRRRGGAGVVVHNKKIYMVGGITNGHMNGYQNWFDEYDPKTGQWRVLPNAPHQRDHFSAAVINNKLYAFAGRRSEHAVGNNFGPTEIFGDVYDFKTGKWESDKEYALPTSRAGTMVLAWNNELVIGGGESEHQELAHNEVEAFNTENKTWRKWPNLVQGRHGSNFAVIGGYVYVASGCGKRGGEPELSTLERLLLP